MSVGVIVAVRGGPSGKSRLGLRLDPRQRVELIQAMLLDTLDTLTLARSVTRILVVTPTPSLAEAARRFGVEVLLEPAPFGINAAFRLGRKLLLNDRHISVVGLLPGDLPSLTHAEVDEAAQIAATGRVVISPACFDGGTGAIFQPANLEVPLLFGPDSFERHSLASNAKAPFVSFRRPGLGFDVDRPADLDHLAALETTGRTAALARVILSPLEATT